jgi:predicted Zn-dependent protease
MQLFRNSSSIFKKILLGLLCAVLLIPPQPVSAQSGLTVIRDTEIENTLKEWATPIVKTASLSTDSINIILVQSDQVNAFVAGGNNIFFYTGLIEKTENPGELLGVFAHELGHITGGHLISGSGAMERASFESVLGMVLGIGAAIATGNGQVGSAIMAGSAGVAQRRFLSHNRINESAADQAALSFLEKAGLSADGMVSFLEKMESEELLPSDQQTEYIRTHPLTQNRLQAVESRSTKSPYYGKEWPAHWNDQHARMKAKLIGFISPGRVPWVYNDSDTSIPARYARTIAAYRTNEIDRALQGIDALITEEPDNAYFHELKGQMLVDFGRVSEAVPSYAKAVELLPDAALIRIAYAHAMMESAPDPATLQSVIDNLQRALTIERRSSYANRLLATAYGRMGREDIAKVYLAEEALLQRNFDYAKRQAESALPTLKENSREWIKAKDIIVFADTQKGLGN